VRFEAKKAPNFLAAILVIAVSTSTTKLGRQTSIKGSLRQNGIFADVHFVELDQLGF